MKEKQLEGHEDKTSYLIIGNNKFKEDVRRKCEKSPLYFNDFKVKEKISDKYLGDLFHSDGLAASVDATVVDRTGKIKGGMVEIAALLEDFRLQAIGGLMTAWDNLEHCLSLKFVGKLLDLDAEIKEDSGEPG